MATEIEVRELCQKLNEFAPYTKESLKECQLEIPEYLSKDLSELVIGDNERINFGWLTRSFENAPCIINYEVYFFIIRGY